MELITTAAHRLALSARQRWKVLNDPLWHWTPSIAPSGMAFYTGDLFPGWKGSLFNGALKSQMLVRLELKGDKVVREERLLQDLHGTIRDVRQVEMMVDFTRSHRQCIGTKFAHSADALTLRNA